MDLGLTDRVVLVTGASSGIGRAAALAFGAEGARVAITYHSRRDSAEQAIADIAATGGEAMAVRLDLADESTIYEAVSRVVERWGRIDVLVANAVAWNDDLAAAAPPLFEDVPPEQWRRMLRTSLEGTFHTVQAAVPWMRKGGWGRIAIVSSGFAERGAVGEAAYATAKAGMHGLSRSLARELGPAGILVNIVMPGLTTTEHSLEVYTEQWHSAARSRTPSGHLSTPDDVGSMIAFICSSANGNITGEILKVDGGM